MYFYFFFLLISIIVLAVQNSGLTKKNKELMSKLHKYCPNCGAALYDNDNSVKIKVEETKELSNSVEPVNNNYEVKTQSSKVKHYNDKEIKNSLILYSGAFLIVLAAIVFLASTWDISHSFIKTGILLLLLFVFFISSYIADKVLNIENASKVFKYIGLCYVPIVLFSLVLFELLGESFRWNTVGSNMYLAISSFITSFIYNFVCRRKKSLFLAIGRVVFHIIGIIFFTLVLSNEYNVILVFLLSYLLVINLLKFHGVIIYNDKFHNILINTLSIILIVFTYISIVNINIGFIIALVILFINLYIWLNKINNYETAYKFVYPLMTILIFTLIPFSLKLNNLWNLTQIMVIIASIILLLHDLVFKNKLEIGSYIFSSMAIGVVYIVRLVFNTDILFPRYLIILFYSLYSLSRYLGDRDNTISHHIFNISLSITILDLFMTLNINVNIITLMFLLFIIASIFSKNIDKKYSLSANIVGNISVGIGYIISIIMNNSMSVKTTLLTTVLFVFYLLYYIIFRKRFYVYASFIFSVLLMHNVINTLSIGYSTLTFAVPMIIYMALSYIIKNKKDSNIIVISSYVLATLMLFSNDNIVSLIITIALIIIYSVYVYSNKLSNNFMLIPLTLFVLNIKSYGSLTFYNINLMLIISILIILGLVIKTILSNKYTYFDLMILIYILSITISFNLNKYFVLLLLGIVFVVFYLTKEKLKRVCMSILYVLVTILIEFVIFDLDLSNISVLKIGILNILLLLITRTIIKAENKECKPIEYVFSVIISYVAMTSYSSIYDGMFYILFLVILVILSYSFKFGPTFLCSLVFIILNVFALTKEFWFSLPWWIYLLIIGIILIIFAIRNEMKDKLSESSLSKIKDKFDL